ncbi:MAG: alpha-L-rhamnosidase C-terminal domain-containing protein, partial [Limisphaerales bacterium]
HYDGMKRYVAYLRSTATNDIVNHGLGDWYDLGPKPPGFSQLTPIALVSTAFYYYDTHLLSRIAALLGRPGEARRFGRQAAQIRAAFNGKFFDPARRDYATGSQTANAMPLVMGLVAPSNRASVLQAIVRDVGSRDDALTSGDVGYRYLLQALATHGNHVRLQLGFDGSGHYVMRLLPEGGRSDMIFAMNNQTNKPGYGYQLARGATSLTESWNARRGSSQDHFMLGQIQEWFYRDLAGIQDAPGSPGFKHIIIRPQPAGDLRWVKASYNSIRGSIVSDWRISLGRFRLRVEIPANTAATVYVPATSAGAVTESGRPAAKSPGIKFLRMSRGYAVFAVASGRYDFQSRF